MPNVEKITKQTENPFVNLYLVEGTNKVNHHFRYYVASREIGRASCRERV